MSNNELQKYCDNISQGNVDIVILGGDIVDENTNFKTNEDAFKFYHLLK